MGKGVIIASVVSCWGHALSTRMRQSTTPQKALRLGSSSHPQCGLAPTATPNLRQDRRECTTTADRDRLGHCDSGTPPPPLADSQHDKSTALPKQSIGADFRRLPPTERGP
jgi:hypothetical protein